MAKLRPLRRLIIVLVGLSVSLVAWSATAAPIPQRQSALSSCADTAYSTEQSFITRGPEPADGNPWITDGDLLSPRGVVCLRNRELLAGLQPAGVPPLPDLGLDGADVISIDPPLVAFSTELRDPLGRFTAGDLLTTDGVAIPNQTLLQAFGVRRDVGLDELKFIGKRSDILAFMSFARNQTRESWLEQVQLPPVLQRYEIDIWFSIEQTVVRVDNPSLLDGDILSARTGTIVISQDALFAPPIPGGLPNRGVDFGLDAFGVSCRGDRDTLRFSTEIVYQDAAAPADRWTDGDVLKLGGAVSIRNRDLIIAFEPLANDLGLDALSFPSERAQCDDQPPRPFLNFLPLLLERFRLRR